MEWTCRAFYKVPRAAVRKSIQKHILVLEKSPEGVEPANDGHSAAEIAKYRAAYVVTLEDTTLLGSKRRLERKSWSDSKPLKGS